MAHIAEKITFATLGCSAIYWNINVVDNKTDTRSWEVKILVTDHIRNLYR
jgi:hypothetical protein